MSFIKNIFLFLIYHLNIKRYKQTINIINILSKEISSNSDLGKVMRRVRL